MENKLPNVVSMQILGAMSEFQDAIRRCRADGICDEDVLAAMMTELIPRLVRTYGPRGTASFLHDLAREVGSSRAH